MQRCRHASYLLLPVLLICLWTPSCASLSLKRTTQTSGTYHSSAWAFTIFSFDVPRGALIAARENAADIHRANTNEIQARVTPDLGWFNWILDIVSIRKATVKGTWGFEAE